MEGKFNTEITNLGLMKWNVNWEITSSEAILNGVLIIECVSALTRSCLLGIQGMGHHLNRDRDELLGKVVNSGAWPVCMTYPKLSETTL
jgi:hypothetical protein